MATRHVMGKYKATFAFAVYGCICSEWLIQPSRRPSRSVNPTLIALYMRLSMTSQRQTECLHQGPEAWNSWRSANPKEKIVLSGGDFSQIDARRMDLSHANLVDCNFSAADLRDADLSYADLRGANFSGANMAAARLVEAFLVGANFEGASLQDADFSKTQLLGVSLKGAQLQRVNFSDVAFWRASLFEYDLEGSVFERASLSKTMLVAANLRHTNFKGAKLDESNLIGADLTSACMQGANLTSAMLAEATLINADFSNAVLFEANLTDTNAEGANFSDANLEGATLVRSNLNKADLTRSRVYGLSAWDVELIDTVQDDLVITRPDMPMVTVGNLAVAQFVYLLLRNESLRQVIDTITSKVVLILGRFTPERKRVLDQLRLRLRAKGYSPVLFDFEKPTSRDLTETIRILAGLSRFVVADLTAARSIPQEMMAIAPDMPSVPIQPIMDASDSEYAMFEHFRRYPWVLKVVRYEDEEQLISHLDELVIHPAEAWLALNALPVSS